MNHKIENTQANEEYIVPIAQVGEVVHRSILIQLEQLVKQRIEHSGSHENKLCFICHDDFVFSCLNVIGIDKVT